MRTDDCFVRRPQSPNRARNTNILATVTVPVTAHRERKCADTIGTVLVP